MTKGKEIANSIRVEYRRIIWGVAAIFALALVLGGLFFYGLARFETTAGLLTNWFVVFALMAILVVLAAGLACALILMVADQSSDRILDSIREEMRQLRAANNRAKALQEMASTLRATLSYEPVVESALDVCSLALEEFGIPNRALVGAVYLYENHELVPVAARRMSDHDLRVPVFGQQGIVAEAMQKAEPTVTHKPANDPELGHFGTFQQCESAICIPLRAGFQIYGAMLLGIRVKTRLYPDQLELFESVADQAVIALQNAQLYQKLRLEKKRIIETEEEARKELARDLHDGPTQSIAAIVMRLNFVTSLMRKDPAAALDELRRIEKLAKDTSKEIRGMLFTLRPLVLDSEGLAAAIERVMDQHRDNSGIRMQLVGGEYGELLTEKAQGVVFYIVEEALGNASKHSQANLIEVRLWQEDDLFVCAIQDDGVGFNVDAVNENYNSRGSLGMINMRERADLVDGTLQVKSRPGDGTRITLIVPLDKAGKSIPMMG